MRYLPLLFVLFATTCFAADRTVYVYTDVNCPACENFKLWEKSERNTSDFKFVYRSPPLWVNEVPAFHFRGNTSTGWAIHYGWSNKNQKKKFDTTVEHQSFLRLKEAYNTVNRE